MIPGPEDLALGVNEAKEYVLKGGNFIGTICHRCSRKVNIKDNIKKWKCLCGAENHINQFNELHITHEHECFNDPDIGPTKEDFDLVYFRINYTGQDIDF